MGLMEGAAAEDAFFERFIQQGMDAKSGMKEWKRTTCQL
jgi:hypothetical protein